jgi:transposase
MWRPHRRNDPEGYRYSRFCELYRSWEGKLSVTMRQTHVGGDELFVDYAGDTVPVIIDRLTDFVGSGLGNSHVRESAGLNRIGARRGSPGVGVRKWRRVQYA